MHPAVLAMDETPHDKAPARMHEPRGSVAPIIRRDTPPAAHGVVLGDSSEVTAINDGPPKFESPPKFSGNSKGSLVIESTKGRPGDDDPTSCMVREEGKASKADATKQRCHARAVAIARRCQVPTKASAALPTAWPIRRPIASTRQPHARRREQRPRADHPSIVLLVASAAAAGLYFSGVIG